MTNLTPTPEALAEAMSREIGSVLVELGPGMGIGVGIFERIAARALAGPLAPILLQVEQQAAEINRLRDRLEINHAYAGAGNRIPFPEGMEHLDGIECRDETIRNLENQIAQLRAERDEAIESDRESLGLYRAARDRAERGHFAENFARRAHAGQLNKSGPPYTGHLGRVAARAGAHAEALGLSLEEQKLCEQVGWLHDTLEDTETTEDDLRAAGFEDGVVSAVKLLTRRPDGRTYLEKIQDIITSGDVIAMIVKLSDNEDNSDPARPSTHGLSPSHAERYRRSAAMLREALFATEAKP